MSLESLIGIIGVVVGVLLSELIRRRNRIEAYSINLFERKLPIYEKLSTLIKDASSDVNKILKDEDFNDTKKRIIVLR